MDQRRVAIVILFIQLGVALQQKPHHLNITMTLRMTSSFTTMTIKSLFANRHTHTHHCSGHQQLAGSQSESQTDCVSTAQLYTGV